MTNQKLPMFKDSIYVVCSLAVSMEMKPWSAWEDIFVDCWGPLSLTLGIHCCGLLGSTFTGGPLLWIVGVHFHWGSTVVDCWGPLSLGVHCCGLLGSTFTGGPDSTVVDCWGPLSLGVLCCGLLGSTFTGGPDSTVVDCWGPLSLGVQTPLLWIVGVHFHWGSRGAYYTLSTLAFSDTQLLSFLRMTFTS